MTQAEWETCDDPAKMVAWLKDHASERKFRLLACACFRAWEATVPCGQAARAAVNLAELHADGWADPRELAAAHHAASDEYYGYWASDRSRAAIRLSLMARVARRVLGTRGGDAQLAAEIVGDRLMREFLGQLDFCGLIRCLFGNPFRPVVIAPASLAWNGGTLVCLAQAIYDGRRWDDMPLLGDALEEAGLDDARVLEHCRGGGPHALGCHAVDAILRIA